MANEPRVPAATAGSPWFPLFYLAVVGGSLLLLASGLGDLSGASWSLLALWIVLIAAIDAAPVTLPGGGYITPASALDYAGILILGPMATAVAEFVATLVLQIAGRRRPLHKAFFNACTFAGTVLVAGRVYGILGGVPGAPLRFPEGIPALLAMGVVYHTLNTGIVALVIGLSEGRRPWHVWQVNYVWTTLHMVAALPFGAAIATAHQALGVWGLVLFVAPLLLARHTFQLYRETKRDLIDFAGVLAGIIDEFDPYTCRHSQRVSRYSGMLAREMGLPERSVENAEYCGLLHDIGKIAVSQRDIVQKPGPLNEEERARVALHADIGADILGRVRAFRNFAHVVRFHHERMDGRGYHRLPGREVPLTSKIVMVADAFDAMTTDRVYRNAMRLEEAVAELDRHAGRQFDAGVVAAFHRLLDRGAMPIEEVPPAFGEPLSRPGLVSAGLV